MSQTRVIIVQAHITGRAQLVKALLDRTLSCEESCEALKEHCHRGVLRLG